jgi:uncharacterized membrane protein YfcA
MEKLAALPIDWANVNWPYSIALVLLVLVCAFVGTALSLGHAGRGSILTALLFATAYMFWTYYPHDLPLPTLEKPQKTAPAATTQPLSPAAETIYRPPATVQR